MIRVNLLPPESRKAEPGAAVAIPWKPLAMGAGGALALLTVALVAGNQWQAGRLDRLRKEWEHIQPQRTDLEEKQKRFQQMQGQASVLDQVKAPKGRWAPRLNLLSDAVAPQVWFTGLKLAPGEPVRLEGSALVVSASNERGAAVTHFLQNLQEQAGFPDWFSGVELKSVEHRQIKQEEVVDFAILLTPTS